jgi:hypothetical protein
MADVFHPSEGPDEEVDDETPIDTGDFAFAVSADDQIEAELLVSACEQAGIPAILQSPRSGPVGTIASPVDGFQILVPRRELERATRLLTERKAALEADPEGAARAAEEEEAAGESAH